jgi:hypothetical protein
MEFPKTRIVGTEPTAKIVQPFAIFFGTDFPPDQTKYSLSPYCLTGRPGLCKGKDSGLSDPAAARPFRFPAAETDGLCFDEPAAENRHPPAKEREQGSEKKGNFWRDG